MYYKSQDTSFLLKHSVKILKLLHETEPGLLLILPGYLIAYT